MHVLALDTSTPRVAVALGRSGHIVGEVCLTGERRHAEQLVPAIQYLSRECSIELSSLAAIAAGIGPGLFTGLRVGLTTARTMAQALRIPVVGVPSLDLVAYPLRHSGRPIVVVVDARRREVFHARYRPVPGGVQRETEYAVVAPGAVVSELTARGEEVLLAGDGVLAHAEVFAELERVEDAGPAAAYPSAAALIELASARVEREEFCAPTDLHPLYLRRSDAEIEWERLGR